MWAMPEIGRFFSRSNNSPRRMKVFQFTLANTASCVISLPNQA
ncbi:MAG: hypothetical protein KUL75_03310 [Sterolibacterium sp.]|nr:hypothetical protein [Sterolibacterium sp.]